MSEDSSNPSKLTVADKWLNVFQTFLLGLFLYLAPATFAALILLAGYTTIMGKANASAWLQDATAAQFLYVFITEMIVLGFLWLLLKHAKTKLADIGVKWPKLHHMQYVIFGFVVYMLLYIAATVLVNIFTSIDLDQEQQIGFNTDISGINLVLAGISLIVLPPIVEEILFRGYLYHRLRRAFSVMWAGFLVSLLFGIAHLQLDTGNIPLWIAAIDTFILSVVLVYVREKTGTIWAGVCIHALKNLIAFIVLFDIYHKLF